MGRSMGTKHGNSDRDMAHGLRKSLIASDGQHNYHRVVRLNQKTE